MKFDLFKKNGEFTGMIKVTFENEAELNSAIANKFNLFHRKFITELFIPKPRVVKCNVCQLFAHPSRLCRNKHKPVCGKCSKDHETKDCKATEEEYKCFHCGESDHITGSYSCVKVQERLQLLIDRREDGQ